MNQKSNMTLKLLLWRHYGILDICVSVMFNFMPVSRLIRQLWQSSYIKDLTHQYLWLCQIINLCLSVFELFTRNLRRIQNTASYFGGIFLRKQLSTIFAKSFILGALFLRTFVITFMWSWIVFHSVPARCLSKKMFFNVFHINIFPEMKKVPP